MSPAVRWRHPTLSTQTQHQHSAHPAGPEWDEFLRRFETYADTKAFGKPLQLPRLLGQAARLLRHPAGIEALAAIAPRFTPAGLFIGSDWNAPLQLQPALVRATLDGGGATHTLECLSQLRFLAAARGEDTGDSLSPELARAFLEDVLARNIDLVFPLATEESRENALRHHIAIVLFGYLLAELGSAGILAALVRECERVMLQRPVRMQRVEKMLIAARRALPDDAAATDPVAERARWMMHCAHGPTALSRAHPDPAAFAAALQGLDEPALLEQAQLFGAAMNDSGLVSPAHGVLLHQLCACAPTGLADALALNSAGRVSLEQNEALIHELIELAVTPDTARCVYGLSRLLNRGILFFPPVAPGLQWLCRLPIVPAVAAELRTASGIASPPSANALLVASTLSVLGQPRGVDQGQNPTCQAARAISLWSQNDAGYLIELITAAARDGEIVMQFEGQEILSNDLPAGLASELHTELDSVSLLLTPHLDRIYMEMSRRVAGRGEDGHRWINPKFHGWWVFRDFASLVDANSGAITDLESFARRFYAAYHPAFNGGRELVYAQPCGVVSTTANAEFIGWHAVSIQRIARDPRGNWRVYFYNPNQDKGQDWGAGLRTSTADNGEWEGESSLLFEQFAMRLYVFHYRARELGDPSQVPATAIAAIREGIAASWGQDREWATSPS